MVGWPQNALIKKFLGLLKFDIPDEVFKPCTIHEAIELARMQEEQVSRNHKNVRIEPPTDFPPSIQGSNVSLPQAKRLLWEAMQKRRKKGLCFNCNE
jgi:hypothetical protein